MQQAIEELEDAMGHMVNAGLALVKMRSRMPKALIRIAKDMRRGMRFLARAHARLRDAKDRQQEEPCNKS